MKPYFLLFLQMVLEDKRWLDIIRVKMQVTTHLETMKQLEHLMTATYAMGYIVNFVVKNSHNFSEHFVLIL